MWITQLIMIKPQISHKICQNKFDKFKITAQIKIKILKTTCILRFYDYLSK